MIKKIKNFINEIIIWFFPIKEEKVFCIGLHKTGTTSLAHACEILGYRVKDYPRIRLFGSRFLWFTGTQLNDYNCFTDSTVIPLYKRLDKKFPNSKFIITIRPISSWLRSCSKWPNFNEKNVQKKRKIYRRRILGKETFDEKIYIDSYNKHHLDVKEYFKNRPNDILYLDISEENKWNILCDFLEKPIPEIEYPHSNSLTNKVLIQETIKDLGLEKKYEKLALKKFVNQKELNKQQLISFFKSNKFWNG